MLLLKQVSPKMKSKRQFWDCGGEKSLGPDGFTFVLFKEFWHVNGDDIFAVVHHFERLASFDPGCNSSFISLIPKGASQVSFVDFSPIGLINSLYKIIAKTLANRFKSVVGSVIGKEQYAYIKGQNILD